MKWTDTSELTATLQVPRSRVVAYLFASAWNIGISLLVSERAARKSGPLFLGIGLAAGIVFGTLAIRALLARTSIAFDRTEVVIRSGLLQVVAFRAPLGELSGFAVVAEDDGSFHVAAMNAAGRPRRLPIDIERLPVAMKVTGSNRRIWATPRDAWELVANRLGEMLESARRVGHDTYRT